jgi:hypothetical protein
MQVSSPESTTITIADHTFRYIGEVTQHTDGGFTLHIDNLDEWSVCKDSQVSYLFTAGRNESAAARCVGETYSFADHMKAYAIDHISLPFFGHSTMSVISTGGKSDRLTTADVINPQPGEEIEFDYEFRKARMRNDLHNGYSLHLWAIRIALTSSGVSPQDKSEIDKRLRIESEVQRACKAQLRFLRCSPNGSGYHGFRDCLCARCHYHPRLSRRRKTTPCSCKCAEKVPSASAV